MRLDKVHSGDTALNLEAVGVAVVGSVGTLCKGKLDIQFLESAVMVQLTVPTKIVEERANSVELKIDLGLEGGVVVKGSSTEQPCSDDVVVQVGLKRNERLHEGQGILDDLGVDNLDTSDLSRGQLALHGGLGRSSNGGADNSQARNETGELHLDDYQNNGLARWELREL